MKFKILALFVAIICVFTVMTACSQNNTGDTEASSANQDVTSDINSVNSYEPAAEGEKYYNSLTGCYVEGNKNKENMRPVAVMINNLVSAQKVQTGLADASIMYETYVEGGITRLLAIYKDVSSVGEIGTVRSARYSYVDLANGHDALYFHCGLDPHYTQDLMSEMGLDNININTGAYGKYGYRVKNGLAREHTMYTTGELVWRSLTENKRRTEKNNKTADLYSPWQNFAAEDKKVTLDGGAATNMSVYFSQSYVTNFKYDENLGKYMKLNKSGNNTDYRTGDNLYYKNVLILFTTVGSFDDNYRVYSELDSGTGYYCTNGTYKAIKWTKGDSYDSIKITDENGKQIEYSTGNSYVCITDKKKINQTKIS